MKKISPPPGIKPHGRRSGMALVVTLALIVLLTAAVLAFFARATANRTVEASRTHRIEAQQLARTARDYVAAQFLQEIVANSSVDTLYDVLICQPTANTFAVPQRPLADALAANAGFANLLRRSVNESVNGVGETHASAHGTATASRNGRSVGLDRWNAPMLLSGGGFTVDADLPHWIYVNADGGVTGTPDTHVIGRFAYTVYDTGGLLDANAAGHPSGLSATDLAGLKGSLAGADLSFVPGITDPDAFVGWRNAGSTASGYAAAASTAAASGFMVAADGDHRLTSRQDLINLARDGDFGITPAALPYLTHFSRTLNAPSWTPTQNAADLKDYDASLRSITRNYKNDAENPASVNRNLPNVRVTQSFTRRDGTTAQIGEPLIKERFPLDKLALVKNQASDPDLLGYFGLTWGGNGWNYRANTIATLDQVANAGREPDFFELLKAAILDGSLGKSTGGDTGVANHAIDTNTDLQILQIGANLIDQVDLDDEPTSILRAAAEETVFGIENHPYIYMTSQTMFRRHDKDYQPANTSNPAPWVTAYQQIQVWNPNRNAAAHPERTYRIRALEGETRVKEFRINPLPNTTLTSLMTDQTGRYISFEGSTAFEEPVLLTPDNISEASPENTLTTEGASLAGFHFGDVRADNNVDGDNNPKNDYNPAAGAQVSFDLPLVYLLEYSDGDDWKPIQRTYPLSWTLGVGMRGNLQINTDAIYSGRRDMFVVWAQSDPRSLRFGNAGAAVNNYLNNTTMRPNTTNYYNAWGHWSSAPEWKVSYPLPAALGFSNLGYTPGDLADNRTDSPTYIADPDGVVRPADGTRATNILAAGSQARPVVLNRPLGSVGEMAYAMRGDPWKSLDFATSSSADAALLDLFCVTAMPAFQAGALNPNSASPEILKALLADTVTDPVISSDTLSASDINDLADKIPTYAHTNPLANRADLARMTEDLALTGTHRDQFLIPSLTHKRQREVLVRALADVSNTRTWNLLLDVVAQAGSFPSGSTSASDFVVTGEQRVWTQLAIDRPSEKILSESSEIFPQ